ncbi:HTH domain-containing protein [Clostridium sp. C105KSO13]|uniref:HTH domain-containing protein n=1 Tax=Clostridium sp. C105KSO13 TaxID=1776045 RepID=UPI000740898B|nr:HTH domain-containing protein [Clostridium sp. C105KSO13]CUX45486.1 HTH domain protein [Clostridium sp. C105KSO13]
MSKTEKLFDLINYVNTKRKFTANDVAEEFGISLRTAHRYLLELDHMGVPLYTEQGRNGGYRTLQGRMLPPIIFNEDEALAIFFAFQSLQFYKSLPFEVDIKSASRKLFLGLPGDVRPQVENLKSVLAFWNRERDIEFTAHSLMNMGEDAQVIEPQEMKEYIVASARKMLKQYE